MSLFIYANKSQTMKHIHQLQIFLTIFTLVLIPNISPYNWVGVGLFNCLFLKKIFKLEKQTLIFLLANCIS